MRVRLRDVCPMSDVWEGRGRWDRVLTCVTVSGGHVEEGVTVVVLDAVECVG